MSCSPAFAPEDKFVSGTHYTLLIGPVKDKKKKSLRCDKTEANFILILLPVIAEGTQAESESLALRTKRLGNF